MRSSGVPKPNATPIPIWLNDDPPLASPFEAPVELDVGGADMPAEMFCDGWIKGVGSGILVAEMMLVLAIASREEGLDNGLLNGLLNEDGGGVEGEAVAPKAP
jgi:hypothetical protein